MFRWTFEGSTPTTATAAQVWSVWTDTDHWHLWDEGNEKVTLDGPFVAGTRGRFKPAGAGAVPFALIEVAPGRGFRDRSYLPLTELDFVHSVSNGQIRHRVEMRGWLTPLFRLVIGRDIAASMPATLARLARLAEQRA